ncbi:hypothetical protein BBJ28_00025673, partial [Nothophytophthora sp. Chile5]
QNLLYQLLVRPVLKSTVGSRDSSGTTLSDFVATGSSFQEIMQGLWSAYSPRVKGRAVRDDDDTWSVVVPELSDWTRVMQFKHKKKVVDSSKNEREWRQWLVKRRGETITLVIFEYGSVIQRQQDHDAFTEACIRPHHTDRAGATAERSLRDVVRDLQTHWDSTFDAEQVVYKNISLVSRARRRWLWIVSHLV